MKDFEIEVGQRLRALREHRGYSRETLSERANISSKFLYEIEAGKKGMSAYTLYQIANALQVSCDFILTGKTPNGDLDYIIKLLSNLNEKDRFHTEQILQHLIELAK